MNFRFANRVLIKLIALKISLKQLPPKKNVPFFRRSKVLEYGSGIRIFHHKCFLFNLLESTKSQSTILQILAHLWILFGSKNGFFDRSYLGAATASDLETLMLNFYLEYEHFLKKNALWLISNKEIGFSQKFRLAASTNMKTLLTHFKTRTLFCNEPPKTRKTAPRTL